MKPTFVGRVLAISDACVAMALIAIGCGSPAGSTSIECKAEPPHDPRLILFLGNSLTRGSGASKASESYPSQTMRMLGSSDAWENLGKDSITTRQMLADAPALVDVQLDGSRPTVAVVWEIGNDLWYGASRDDAWKHYASYCAARRAAGVATIVATTVPKRSNPTAPPTWDADRIAVNTRLRAEWPTIADRLADVDLFDVVDTSKYGSDGIHFNDAGYADIARVVAEQLR